MKPRCYMCDDCAVGVEHVPAKCFFPREHRKNLITVPSCSSHNNDTSKDDEYVRGVIVAAQGNNSITTELWKGPVRKSFINSPKLFFKTFSKVKGNSAFQDRVRIDAVMIKIAYALYYHIYKKSWDYHPAPFYHQIFFDDDKTDIEGRLLNYQKLPSFNVYEGENQKVFKYQYFEGKVSGKPNCMFRLVFYENFEVIILPVDNEVYKLGLTLDLQN